MDSIISSFIVEAFLQSKDSSAKKRFLVALEQAVRFRPSIADKVLLDNIMSLTVYKKENGKQVRRRKEEERSGELYQQAIAVLDVLAAKRSDLFDANDVLWIGGTDWWSNRFRSIATGIVKRETGIVADLLGAAKTSPWIMQMFLPSIVEEHVHYVAEAFSIIQKATANIDVKDLSYIPFEALPIIVGMDSTLAEPAMKIYEDVAKLKVNEKQEDKVFDGRPYSISYFGILRSIPELIAAAPSLFVRAMSLVLTALEKGDWTDRCNIFEEILPRIVTAAPDKTKELAVLMRDYTRRQAQEEYSISENPAAYWVYFLQQNKEVAPFAMDCAEVYLGQKGYGGVSSAYRLISAILYIASDRDRDVLCCHARRLLDMKVDLSKDPNADICRSDKSDAIRALKFFGPARPNPSLTNKDMLNEATDMLNSLSHHCSGITFKKVGFD